MSADFVVFTLLCMVGATFTNFAIRTSCLRVIALIFVPEKTVAIYTPYVYDFILPQKERPKSGAFSKGGSRASTTTHAGIPTPAHPYYGLKSF